MSAHAVQYHVRYASATHVQHAARCRCGFTAGWGGMATVARQVGGHVAQFRDRVAHTREHV